LAASLKWTRDGDKLISGDGKRFYEISKVTAGNQLVHQLRTTWPTGQTDKQNFQTQAKAKRRAQTVTNNAERRERPSGT
jgi:hypothetical protein